MKKTLPLAAVIALLLAAVPTAGEAATMISKTEMTGPYTVTLKVLPAESFTGPNAKMAWDGGAKAVEENGSVRPNHHMVVFVKENDKPVEDAKVTIECRRAGAKASPWMHLPVARMHEVGESLATTHYGNNVRLNPGRYQVKVTVNGSKPLEFGFELPAGG